MAVRRIKQADRMPRSTFVTLDCGHQRSFGGHMYNGKVQLPSELLGQEYDCVEPPCDRTTGRPKSPLTRI